MTTRSLKVLEIDFVAAANQSAITAGFSVLIKKPDGRIFVYTKGADSSLITMSDKKQSILI